MLHSREFTLSAGGIGPAKIGGNYQTQHGIAEKFERFVMELTSLIFRSRRYLFVGPGAMCYGALQESAIFKLVSENCFEEVEVRKCNPLFLQGRSNCNKAGSVVKLGRQSFRL